MWTIKKCVRIERGSEYLPDLPEEIMIDILQRLPVYSILALRCLSKQWKNLIGDPKFYNIYHTNSVALFIFRSKLYCVLFKHPNKCTKGMLPPYTLHSLPFHFDEIGFAPELLLGWSNGLFCVLTLSKSSDNAFMPRFDFHNLLTRTSFAVVDAPPRPWSHYGVGYDRLADDHKILVVPWTEEEDNSQFWVYSCKNLCWNMFDGFPCGEYTYDKPNKIYRAAYSFNSILHSVGIIAGESLEERKRAAANNKARPVCILTYDLHSRRFGQIAVPCGRISPALCRVTEFEGQLCFMAKKGSIMDVWVMKEYGVADSSWTKLFSCQSLDIPIYHFAYTNLYESEDGTKNMLFALHGYLYYYCYNFNDDKLVEETRWCDFTHITNIPTI